MIQIGGVYTTFCHKEGILMQKYRDRNSTLKMTGRRFHRTMEMIPALPW